MKKKQIKKRMTVKVEGDVARKFGDPVKRFDEDD